MSASTVFLLLQWIYVSQPSFPKQLPFLPSSFPMCLLFLLFILPVCAFISVYATHIVPVPLSCSRYFHPAACTYKPLLSLIDPFRFPVPFLLFFPGFVVSINIFLWLVPPLSFLPCFPSQFCFNNYSMHHLFALVICPFRSIFILFC